MNPRPAAGAEPGTLHWLHRPTGEPHWMVATWTGEGWRLMDGNKPHTPEMLVWWHYVAPATPPDLKAPTAGLSRAMGGGDDLFQTVVDICRPVTP